MENYQMSRPCSRPYHTTCGMTRPQMAPRMSEQKDCAKNTGCNCRMPNTKTKNPEMYTHVDHMEPAMGYVPCQKFGKTFDLCYALNVGTIFPQLCKPFCGKRGVGR